MNGHRWKKILCPVNIDDPPLKELEYVRQLMRTDEVEEVHFLYVDEYLPVMYYPMQITQPVYDGNSVPGGVREKWETLKAVALNEAQTGAAIVLQIISGDIGSSVAHYAKQQNIDLVVIESHPHRTLLECFYVSCAEKIMKMSQIPVLVLKTKMKGE